MKELLEFWLCDNGKGASGEFSIENALRPFKNMTIENRS